VKLEYISKLYIYISVQQQYYSMSKTEYMFYYINTHNSIQFPRLISN